MKKQQTFKVPNALICDVQLTLTARIVATMLYAYSNPLGYCHKSLAKLATLAGCSVSTVRKSISELETAGWLTSTRTYIWRSNLGRRVYGPKEYRVQPLPKKGWTLIPRDYLQNINVTPSAFVIGLYLYVAAGNGERRAYPSIKKIAKAIGIAERTVCRALHQIKRVANFLVTHCKRLRGDFAANNYHICMVVTVKAQRVDCCAFVKQRTTGMGPERRAKRSPLCAFIVNLKEQLCNLFSRVKVLTKVANKG